MSTEVDPTVEIFLYIKGLMRPIRRYFLDLPPCCQHAFRQADTDRAVCGPEGFFCTVHGPISVNMDIACKVIEKNHAQRFHILTCHACTQKNRVDMARVMADGIRPVCGKCREPLQGKTSN